MNVIRSQIIITSIIVILVFITGVFLGKKGKPYNSVIITVHKLLSLAVVVLIATIIYYQHHVTSLKSTDIIIITIITILFIAALLSGGTLTLNKPTPNFVTFLHKIISGVVIGVSVYLIYRFY